MVVHVSEGVLIPLYDSPMEGAPEPDGGLKWESSMSLSLSLSMGISLTQSRTRSLRLTPTLTLTN